MGVEIIKTHWSPLKHFKQTSKQIHFIFQKSPRIHRPGLQITAQSQQALVILQSVTQLHKLRPQKAALKRTKPILHPPHGLLLDSSHSLKNHLPVLLQGIRGNGARDRN
jgi:hypothetical protein